MSTASLQAAWDRTLIEAWFKTPDRPMPALFGDFVQASGLSEPEVKAALKRVPTAYVHFRCGVRRFVCGYVKKLGERLWALYEIDPKGPAAKIDALVTRLAQVRISAEARDPAAERETKEKQATQKDYRRHRVSTMVKKAGWEAQKASNQWHVCK